MANFATARGSSRTLGRSSLFIICTAGLTLSLAGCGGNPNAIKERDYGGGRAAKEQASQGLGGQTQETGSLFGPGGLFGSKAEKRDDQSTGVAVNAFLWRASLDTINFIPLVQADPFGGVIITDWYTPAEAPNERMKVQVTILDRALRADGVRVSVFKQQQNPKGGGWVDAQVDPQTNTDIENAILTRARQLRIAQGGS
ncbi:MAG: DUF3576 domain-containing protein [Proteobacteria bacterium]|nr:DUF3576 domain-containing protein [Pseudomonadota bacterium]